MFFFFRFPILALINKGFTSYREILGAFVKVTHPKIFHPGSQQLEERC